MNRSVRRMQKWLEILMVGKESSWFVLVSLSSIRIVYGIKDVVCLYIHNHHQQTSSHKPSTSPLFTKMESGLWSIAAGRRLRICPNSFDLGYRTGVG